ncbi:arginine N-succinyltransferase [Teredinibacter turnerae]|uniref:arginine N-succinyltransferase n=1 Tax=Teredinibacter turnerae TaxID=2426 RepID=UPI000381573C|nr:arginine N-succinyltransferase [Teredinibacter turnerae]
MLLVRPARIADIDDLLELSHIAGSGMTSLPPEREILLKKIQRSLASFTHDAFQREDYFLLVLEDTQNKKVIGTAGIYACTGSDQAFYAYRVTPANHYSHSLKRDVRAELLHLTNDYTDCSEIGTLFINGDYKGNGSWLARSRYLLMAQFRDRFCEHVIAQIRGWLDTNNRSPFWDAIGQHFFEMDYNEADRLCGTGSNQFITELMPRHPIYTHLLPETARETIGTAHPAAARARALLEQEGFQYENLIDIFDGGPMLRAPIETIASIQRAHISEVSEATNLIHTESLLVTNTQLGGYRAVKAIGQISEHGAVLLEPETISALNVTPGDAVQYMRLEEK